MEEQAKGEGAPPSVAQPPGTQPEGPTGEGAGGGGEGGGERGQRGRGRRSGGCDELRVTASSRALPSPRHPLLHSARIAPTPNWVEWRGSGEVNDSSEQSNSRTLSQGVVEREELS